MNVKMPSRKLKKSKGSYDFKNYWSSPSTLEEAIELYNSGILTPSQEAQLLQDFPSLRHYYDLEGILQSDLGADNTLIPVTSPSPTISPDSPVSSPVSDPSDGATPSPTAMPVENPSPTLSPVSDPSDGATPSPTAMPVENPSPTLSPVSDPSDGATPSPTPTTNVSPISQGKCVASDGSFGQTEGGSIVVPLQLDYEVETDPSFDGDLVSEVMPPLESAMLDFLLPIFFSQCGNSNRNLRMVQKRSVLTNIEVVGFSSSPQDLRKGPCTSTEDSEGSCSEIESRFTLYAEADENESYDIAEYTRTQQGKIHSSICDEMASGGNTLKSVHPAIVKLNCVKTADPFESPTKTAITDIRSGEGAKSTVSSTNIVLMSSAAVVFVVGIAAFRKYYVRKDEGDDDSAKDSENEDLDDSGEGNPSNSFGSTLPFNKSSDRSMNSGNKTFDQSLNKSKNSTHEHPLENVDLNTSYNSNTQQGYLPSSLESPTGISTFAKRSYYSSKDAPLVSSLDLSSVSSPDSSTVSDNSKRCLLP